MLTIDKYCMTSFQYTFPYPIIAVGWSGVAGKLTELEGKGAIPGKKGQSNGKIREFVVFLRVGGQ